jgi:hypothetical protein
MGLHGLLQGQLYIYFFNSNNFYSVIINVFYGQTEQNKVND